MKSIQVANGDIVLTNGNLKFAQGSSKLVQDLTLWLKEPLNGQNNRGPGFTTPAFGSLLSSFIGTSNSGIIEANIKTEVMRILGLYQQYQISRLQNAQTLAALDNWNKSEIIQRVLSVNVTSDTFTASVAVTILTLANTTANLSILVGQNGITVS